jgi:hypothetical protein
MIYFARPIDSNLVKIGYTKSDAASRVDTLQVGNPIELEIMATADGDIRAERALHGRFRASRVRSEWFRMTPGLAGVIALANPGFAALVRLEPRLLDLAHDAGDIEYDEQFCANAFWYGYGPYLSGIKERMQWLVGHLRKDGPAELRTSEAYSLAYDVLYKLLPACRDCGCL